MNQLVTQFPELACRVKHSAQLHNTHVLKSTHQIERADWTEYRCNGTIWEHSKTQWYWSSAATLKQAQQENQTLHSVCQHGQQTVCHYMQQTTKLKDTDKRNINMRRSDLSGGSDMMGKESTWRQRVKGRRALLDIWDTEMLGQWGTGRLNLVARANFS